MAGLMRDRFNLGFIDVGGWDTHVNQGSAQGQLANLLTNLGTGLAAFAGEMGPLWDRTVVVVLSEFGRTFRENGTRGTDHGHGSVHWVLGGAVHGGRIAGEEVTLTETTLNQNRDLPVLTEYRAMLGGIFKRMYSLDQARLARVFPGTMPLDLDLVLARGRGGSTRQRPPGYLMPTTIESGPTRCSTRVDEKPASRIQPAAVGAGVVEAARRLDQHVEAHHQAERVLRPIVVDDRLVDDERAARPAARRTPSRSASAWSADPSRAGCAPSGRRRPSAGRR